MRLLWNNRWRRVPAYSPSPVGELVEVEVSVALARLRDPSGRAFGSPVRKVATFIATEGPGSTTRKVRSKRRDSALLDDYRIALVLGRFRGDGRRVVALSCRVPACASLMPCHRDLVEPVGDDFGEDELRVGAARLTPLSDALAAAGAQSYLYSGSKPPAVLREALATALAEDGRPSGPSSAPKAVRPPAGSVEGRVLELGPGRRPGAPHVAVLGAGDYARTQIIPALKRADLGLAALADREPQIAAEVAEAAGFSVATTDPMLAIERLLGPGLVAIATAHDSHARLAADALGAGHRVHLEKPAVVTAEDLDLLRAAAESAPGMLELGFNRRYSPSVARARELLARERGPTSLVCTVREITLDSDHWYFWPNQGTRIAGNLCHWIDLGVYLIAAAAARELSLSPPVPGVSNDNTAERSLTVNFDEGSTLVIVATDRGDGMRGVQETIEARRGATTLSIDDLRSVTAMRGGLRRRHRRVWRDKGHERMLAAVADRFTRGAPAAYPLRDLVLTSKIQLAAIALAPSGGSVVLEDALP